MLINSPAIWERLSQLSPGGAPRIPIEVASASVVDGSARSVLCARCEGVLRLEEHRVEVHDGVSLRVAQCVCLACGAARKIYYRIVNDRAN
ncbi:MAG: hypothetical protein NVSMB1_07590 [Polyangiales bacterium]